MLNPIAANLPKTIQNLVELLEYQAWLQPHQPAYTFLEQGEEIGEVMTYGDLQRRARAMGAYLQSITLAGDRVLLVFPNRLDFIIAFMGCLYAGVIAVPVNPPHNSRSVLQFLKLTEIAAASVALTNPSMRDRVKALIEESSHPVFLNWVVVDAVLPVGESDWTMPDVNQQSLAFLQFTSGSTGSPKGVMVSHGNLLHNFKLLHCNFDFTPEATIVTWLPFFHDWGLIGCILYPMSVGMSTVFFDPPAFVSKPLRWLQAISKFRAQISCAPNFAYEQCLKMITEQQRDTLDLSGWEMAMVGAEPVRWETIERFSHFFAPCGFRKEAFYPSYGLAESTLIVSGGKKHASPIYITLQKQALEQNQVVLVQATAAIATQSFVGCGQQLLDQQIAIINPETHTRCDPTAVGEVWIAGPSIAQGYWQQPSASQDIFAASLAGGEGRFLRTGDLGFLWQEELFITGRLKDVIILAGHNYYPQDIELSVERSHPMLRSGFGAAFSIEIAESERLVIVQELNFGRKPDLNLVIGSIQKAVVTHNGICANAIAIVKPGSIPKTSSGKIRRQECKKIFLAQQLECLKAWQDW